MGVGRNLGYRKSLFFKSRGFSNHYHIASGDDDLFVNAVANRHNTKVCLKSEGFTFSETKGDWISWFRQKQRHLSTGKFYRPGIKSLLVLFSLSHIAFYLLFITLLVFLFEWRWLLAIYVSRLLVQALVFTGVNKNLKEKNLIIFTPLFDFLYTLFYIIFAPAALFRKSKKWE